jgi:hypothetical protein
MARFINFMKSLVPTVSPLLTEELLEKLMLAKTKHKNLWKFY